MQRVPSWRAACLLVLICPMLLTAATAYARPPYKQTLGRYYEPQLSKSLKACSTCHEVPPGKSEKELAEESPPHNAFGERLRELGEQLEEQGKAADLSSRLHLIADEDSDGDGVSNELELLSGHAPGDAKDKPSAGELVAAQKIEAEFKARYPWTPLAEVKRPAVPESGAGWGRNPIDAFVSAEHVKRGLRPRPEAAANVLLRRVYLDLTGLPPTRQELEAYLVDKSPDAYEKVVDRLLASPRYGERWGRHWMDVWRYSDWSGWGKIIRHSQPHLWRWRDWIVRSLNEDKGYDRMVLEMLAGDELFPDDPQALAATGFLTRNYDSLFREQWMQNTVDHTSQAFLGMTLKCARCHDHMFDAVFQKEYYQFRAVFEPYNVRLDYVPGQADTFVAGISRVYDADLKADTYLYVRGDERNPDKSAKIQPGVIHAIHGPKFKVASVALPLYAVHPERQSFVVKDRLQANKVAVTAARNRLRATGVNRKEREIELAALIAGAGYDAKQLAQKQNDTDERTESLKRAVDKAILEDRLSKANLVLAEAKRDTYLAKIQADKLDTPSGRQEQPQRWRELTKIAAIKQREVAVAEAEANQLVQEQSVEEMRDTLAMLKKKAKDKPSDESAKNAAEKGAGNLKSAENRLNAARNALVEAQRKLIKPPTDNEKTVKNKVGQDKVAEENKDFPETSTGRRAALARWIANPQNALTARVAANHIWGRHFVQAIVPSTNDFGNNGMRPTHPALLDWLAAELMSPEWQLQGTQWRKASTPVARDGAPWAMKHLHRLIVTSATYRMASTTDEKDAARDPENIYLWRMPSRRMEAEVVRDSTLLVSGRLDSKMGGPEIDYNEGQSIPRRSIYFCHAAEKQVEFLKIFDEAAPNECYRRKESIIPQQALAMVNSELLLEQSRLLARKLDSQVHGDTDRFITTAFEQVLTRMPTTAEQSACRKFLSEQQSMLGAESKESGPTAKAKSDTSLPAAESALRARENLILVLFNHNDFVTIR